MKISVITPSYNQVNFLEQTIKSVLGQGYDNLEWIVMDGGSSDGSVETLEKYSTHFTYWQSQSDGGQSAAINAGMARATGDICCWLNSDDLFVEGSLQKVAEFFSQNPDEKWLIGNGEFRDLKGKKIADKIPNGTSYEDFLDWEHNSINQPSVFWRRSLWKEVGGLNESLDFTMDYELWLKFSQVKPAAKLDKLLAITIIHADAKTSSCGIDMFIEHALVLYDFGHKDLAIQRLHTPLYRSIRLGQVLAPLKKINFISSFLKKKKLL